MDDSNAPLFYIILIITITILCFCLITAHDELERQKNTNDCNTEFSDEERCIIVNGLFHNISESSRGSRQRSIGIDLLNKLHYEDCK